MDHGPSQTRCQGRHTDGQSAYEKLHLRSPGKCKLNRDPIQASQNGHHPECPPHQCWEEGPRNPHSWLVGMQAVQPMGETFRRFVTKLNTLLLCDPTITLRGIYPTEWKTCVHTETCTWILIAAPFITDDLGSHRDVLQWVRDKPWSIRTWNIIQLKRHELSHHEKTWRRLKCKSLREQSLSEMATCCVIPIT